MLLSAFAVLLLFPFASAGVHKFKLQKISRVVPGQALETTYHAEKWLPINIPSWTWAALVYDTEIKLGSPPPPQTFKVILDTGDAISTVTPSSNLWIPSIQCKSIACFLHAEYDSVSSERYKPNGSVYSVQYGTGSAKGFVSQDTLTIGDLPEPGLTFAFVRFDVNHIVPPFYNMLGQGLLDEPVFSFRIGSSEEGGGEVTFGGIDESAYSGDIIYAPVHRTAYWELDNAGAVIDTGTSLIATPVDSAEQFSAIIGATSSWTGQYVVDCSNVPSLPDLVFYLDGKPYPLNSSDYIIEVQGICVSSLQGLTTSLPDDAFWVLGDVFLRRYYTVFDFGRDVAGFARSV
ncbi:Asp-domain-containing protein [Pisolithus marmoratus]|nr:Asp-domain-containing protein [Pisolithus marmoratus]